LLPHLPYRGKQLVVLSSSAVCLHFDPLSPESETVRPQRTPYRQSSGKHTRARPRTDTVAVLVPVPLPCTHRESMIRHAQWSVDQHISSNPSAVIACKLQAVQQSSACLQIAVPRMDAMQCTSARTVGTDGDERPQVASWDLHLCSWVLGRRRSASWPGSAVVPRGVQCR
jgi:hypothetical protein